MLHSVNNIVVARREGCKIEHCTTDDEIRTESRGVGGENEEEEEGWEGRKRGGGGGWILTSCVKDQFMFLSESTTSSDAPRAASQDSALPSTAKAQG